MAVRKAKSAMKSIARVATESEARTSGRDAAHAIYDVVRAIPRGKVATYGQVAELAGLPRGHRQVARAMRECPAKLPWQRVVGRKDARRAQVSIQEGEHAELQRSLLKHEGVVFDASGCIVLAKSGWLPASTRRAD